MSELKACKWCEEFHHLIKGFCCSNCELAFQMEEENTELLTLLGHLIDKGNAGKISDINWPTWTINFMCGRFDRLVNSIQEERNSK